MADANDCPVLAADLMRKHDPLECRWCLRHRIAALEQERERLQAAGWWLEGVVRRTGVSAHAEGLDYGELQTAMLVVENTALGRDLPGFEWGPTLKAYRHALTDTEGE